MAKDLNRHVVQVIGVAALRTRLQRHLVHEHAHTKEPLICVEPILTVA